MNTIPLQATVRETFGKGEARKLRAKGNIPALVYRAGAAPKHIAIDPVVLTKLFRASNNQNTLLDVQVDGVVEVGLVCGLSGSGRSGRLGR